MVKMAKLKYDSMFLAKHPLQPFVLSDHNVIRFKENKLVTKLLDNYNLNKLVIEGGYSKEDYEQLMQLIGYSFSGYSELSQISNETWERANTEFEKFKNLMEKKESDMKEPEVPEVPEVPIHKHADMIHAWADGAIIQEKTVRDDLLFVWKDKNPLDPWDDDTIYRIYPKCAYARRIIEDIDDEALDIYLEILDGVEYLYDKNGLACYAPGAEEPLEGKDWHPILLGDDPLVGMQNLLASGVEIKRKFRKVKQILWVNCGSDGDPKYGDVICSKYFDEGVTPENKEDVDGEWWEDWYITTKVRYEERE